MAPPITSYGTRIPYESPSFRCQVPGVRTVGPSVLLGMCRVTWRGVPIFEVIRLFAPSSPFAAQQPLRMCPCRVPCEEAKQHFRFVHSPHNHSSAQGHR